MGDWMPLSPSPRTLFSSMLGDDVGSMSVSDRSCEGESGFSFHGSGKQLTSSTPNSKDGLQAFRAIDQTAKSSTSKQITNSRGSLLERMANRAGFSAPRLNTECIRPTEMSQNVEVRSPCLIISPGLSPTSLLDSPVFLSNALAQPSPTTGKFSFVSSGRCQSSATSFPDKRKQNFFENMNASSFAPGPITESGSQFFGLSNKLNPINLQPSFPSIEVSVQLENALPHQSLEHSNSSTLNQKLDLSRLSTEKDTEGANMFERRACAVNAGQSPPVDEQQEDEVDQRGGDLNTNGAPAEDGYSWRKYGQKQVKGSEYPCSYYKCTHSNCPVKKKVEKSPEGLITEIVYKGEHSHPKPQPSQKSALGSLCLLNDVLLKNGKQDVTGTGGDPSWSIPSDWSCDSNEVTSATLGPGYGNRATSLQGQNGGPPESADALDGSSTFTQEDEDDRGTHGSALLDCDGEGDESESKRRKIEMYTSDMSGATRAIREPRVVVQTTSDVDILEDGYRWRKYGQKVVKGNPNPRSYYKCTSAGCPVRKHVERASHDLKSVITTYEGKHNHEVPVARNSNHTNSGVSSDLPSQSSTAFKSHLHRHEHSQGHISMAPSPFGSFGLAARAPLGPSQGFGFGFNPRGFSNLAIGGLQRSQGQLPLLPIRQFLGQPGTMNGVSVMLPKEEPKVEPVSDPHSTLPNGLSIYHQIMSWMPLGPQI